MFGYWKYLHESSSVSKAITLEWEDSHLKSKSVLNQA